MPMKSAPAGDPVPDDHTANAEASAFVQQVSEALGSAGPFARAQPGFTRRAQQIDMAVAVAQAIEAHSVVVVEAGTGVGKTFAYLVPALLSGERVVVSTATKALQDQLFGRDLPRVLQALGLPMRTAMLKGRSSYLCMQRLQATRRAEPDGALHAAGLAQIERWAQVTRSGDLAELALLDERSSLAALVSSTRDNCLGAECPQLDGCHVNQARRDAMNADIVVVNHHLLFADMAVREAGVAELLPRAGVVVVDEAHQLSDIGLQFLGQQWGSTGLRDLARDLVQLASPAALGMADWHGLAAQLQACALRLLNLAKSAGAHNRYAWRATKNVASAQAEDGAANMDDGWHWIQEPPSHAPSPGAPLGVDEGAWADALAAASHCLQDCAHALALAHQSTRSLGRLGERADALAALADVFAAPADAASVRWLDLTRDAFCLVESPPQVAAILRERLMRLPRAGASTDTAQALPNPPATAWIFTSATLGDEQSLRWFTEPCGLQDALSLRVASPFDYALQAALYVPADAPAPADSAHSPWVAQLAAGAASVLGGRTLVLTTTLRALRAVSDALRAELAGQPNLVVLVQGESPKRWLMERFRAGDAQGAPGCVLVATASFWEGFDVPGPSLQLVIIDKLPFPPPGDPLVDARMQTAESAGKNAFAHHAVPEAAVALRQGAGRLIRSETDRGILVVCDPRLVDKGYGKRLLRALPPMRRLEDAQGFRDAVAVLATLSAG